MRTTSSGKTKNLSWSALEDQSEILLVRRSPRWESPAEGQGERQECPTESQQSLRCWKSLGSAGEDAMSAKKKIQGPPRAAVFPVADTTG